jgi:hypothetical protein
VGFFNLMGKTESGCEMAQKTFKKPVSDAASSYVQRLRSAKLDQTLFEAVLVDMNGDPLLRALDFIDIANGYSAVGLKVTSKATALAKIKKRFVELGRQHGKNKAAEKIQPW